MIINHPFVSAKTDGGDATLVRPSNWNAAHAATVEGADAAAVQGSLQKSRRTFFCDFESGSVHPLVTATSGVGASANNAVAPPAGSSRVGILIFNTGTDTTGRAALRSSADAFRLGNMAAVVEVDVEIPNLSDGTNTYALWLGIGDAQTTDPTDGVYFNYNSTVSANWRACTSNGGTRTESASSIAVAAGAFIKLRIEVNAAATSASYFINGVEINVSPITTNLPVDVPTGFNFNILKSAGTTARTFELDYVLCDLTLTTSR